MSKLESLLEQRNEELKREAEDERRIAKEKEEQKKLDAANRAKKIEENRKSLILGLFSSLPIGWFGGSLVIAFMGIRGCFMSGNEYVEFKNHLDAITPYYWLFGILVVILIVIIKNRDKEFE